MRKLILLSILLLVSIFTYSQTSTFGGIGLRVNDSTAYQSNAAGAHSAGYYDIYFNNQATTKHWDVWNGSSYDHVFSLVHPKVLVVACSDETTALTTGTGKITFRIPYAMTVTAVRASVTTAQGSGSVLTVDINDGGTTILSTKLTLDNSEKTSTTAATPAVISDSALADDAEITVDIDQVGTSPTGLKVTLIGY